MRPGWKSTLLNSEDSILNYSTTALDAKHHEGTTTSDVEIAIGGMTTFPVSSGS
jgi:hypothetical protein